MKRHENGRFSEVKETPALPQVKISPDHCAFCFNRSGIYRNFLKSLGESPLIRYFFTACTFISNFCFPKGRKTGFLPITFVVLLITYSSSDFAWFTTLSLVCCSFMKILNDFDPRQMLLPLLL